MNTRTVEAALKSLELGNNVQISKVECRRLWSYAKSQGYEQDGDLLVMSKDEVYLDFKPLGEKRMRVESTQEDWDKYLDPFLRDSVETNKEGPPWPEES